MAIQCKYFIYLYSLQLSKHKCSASVVLSAFNIKERDQAHCISWGESSQDELYGVYSLQHGTFQWVILNFCLEIPAKLEVPLI